MKTAVIALGGNALIRPGQKGLLSEQLRNVEHAMEHTVSLIKKGYRIVITHGNGPQVGNILLREEIARKVVPKMPLYVGVAESQGMIGYMIQESLYNKLHKHGIRIPVVTLITQILVDPKDPAFGNPSKPIGPVYKSRQDLPKEWTIKKTARGFRRVVPSPEPMEIMEAEAIRRVSEKAIVVACGGGGIPVVRKESGIYGVDAVIDKDLCAERLGGVVGADLLVILTDVNNVYLDFRKPGQEPLGKISLSELKQYYKEGHFRPGSMEPKIRASIRFLESGGKVIITGFDCLEKALNGEVGTVIE